MKVPIRHVSNVLHEIIEAVIFLAGFSSYFVVYTGVLPLLHLVSSSNSFKMLLGGGHDVIMESKMVCVTPRFHFR